MHEEVSKPKWSGIPYLRFMQLVHETLAPSTYFEIGTAKGSSLALSNCNSIAVDPRFQMENVNVGRKPRLTLLQDTSDNVFANVDLLTIAPDGIDLAFLDGLHLAEYLLRDLLNTLRYCRRDSIIFLHDCLPLNSTMAERKQRPYSDKDEYPGWWTGDVWKVIPIIQKYFVDARVVYLDCPPTGLVMMTNFSPRWLGGGSLSFMAQLEGEVRDVDSGGDWLSRLYSGLTVVDSRRLEEGNSLRSFLDGVT